MKVHKLKLTKRHKSTLWTVLGKSNTAYKKGECFTVGYCMQLIFFFKNKRRLPLGVELACTCTRLCPTMNTREIYTFLYNITNIVFKSMQLFNVYKNVNILKLLLRISVFSTKHLPYCVQTERLHTMWGE